MKLYDRHSIDYQFNIAALEEMENIVPMTLRERKMFRLWVRKGHEVESNPWHYTDADGCPLNFLQAFRLRYGCSYGPWDYWKGPEEQLFWDEDLKCILSADDV